MKNHGKKNLFQLIVLFFFTVFASFDYGQEIKFGQLTVEDGLSNSFVNCILQDKIGFIWFGTDDGLNRYDGYDIIVYRNEPENSKSLSDNIIWSLYEDRAGYLWIGTKGGYLNKYDPFNDTFEHWDFDTTGKQDVNITFVLEDSKYNIWIGTYRHGLYRLNKSGNRFDNWKNDIYGTQVLSSNFIISILEDSQNNIWISTYLGLDKFNPGSQQKPFTQISDDNFKTPVWYLGKSSFFQNTLWICKLDGLLKFNTSTEKYSQINLPNSMGLKFGNSVSSVVEENFGDENILWVGTYGGLVRHNLTTNESIRFVQKKNSPAGLISNQINDLIIDKSGVVWIATDNGLNIYSPKRAKFNFLISKNIFSEEFQELQNKNIRAITPANNGLLFFGTETGLYATNNFTKKSLFKQTAELNSLNVWSLFNGNSDNLWIGTYGDGLKELNLKTNSLTSWQVANPDFNASPYYYVKSILQDDEGMLWLGFWGGGLARLNPSNKKIEYWRHETDNTESLSFNDIWIICKDRKGRVWIGTNGGGLNLFNKVKHNSFFKWKSDKTNNRSLSNNNIFTIYESIGKNNSDTQTVLWIGTANGLNKFVIKDEEENQQSIEPSVEIFSYTVEDGLPDNSIESILEDESGNLWIGTSSGISFFNVEKNLFTNYNHADGLTRGSFNSTSAYKTKEGIMLFGGTTGLNIFDPNKISQSSYLPPVLITEFKLFNQSSITDRPSDIMKNIFNVEELFLSYNQNDFSVQYAVLDYNAPENNNYAYMMEGFDKDWIYSGTRRFVTYTNLDPGEYVFRVKATNSDGLWNERGTKLALIISPPFWATWWAYTIYILAFIGGLAFIRATEIKRRQKKEEERLRREREAALLREAKLRAITIEQEKEIEKQKIRNRIAQDLHDEIGSNLSSISLMSELIQKDGKINAEAFEKIKRIQKVAKGSSQAMRDIVWLTNPSSDSIKDLVSKMNEVANDMLGGLKWQFDFSKNFLDAALVPEVKRNIFFIYKESLNNILKHANAKNITIELKTSDNKLFLIIKDDGSGFNTSNVFNGNGLKNLRSRAKEIAGEINIESSPGKGTTINLMANITQVRD